MPQKNPENEAMSDAVHNLPCSILTGSSRINRSRPHNLLASPRALQCPISLMSIGIFFGAHFQFHQACHFIWGHQCAGVWSEISLRHQYSLNRLFPNRHHWTKLGQLIANAWAQANQHIKVCTNLLKTAIGNKCKEQCGSTSAEQLKWFFWWRPSVKTPQSVFKNPAWYLLNIETNTSGHGYHPCLGIMLEAPTETTHAFSKRQLWLGQISQGHDNLAPRLQMRKTQWKQMMDLRMTIKWHALWYGFCDSTLYFLGLTVGVDTTVQGWSQLTVTTCIWFGPKIKRIMMKYFFEACNS